MTRGVLLAWCGGAVAVLAILTALLWPMDADVAPLPAATSASVPAVPLPPTVAAAPPAATAGPDVDAVATSRVRAVPTVRPRPATPAPVAPAAPARAPAAIGTGTGVAHTPAPTNASGGNLNNGGNGEQGGNGDAGFFPGF